MLSCRHHKRLVLQAVGTDGCAPCNPAGISNPINGKEKVGLYLKWLTELLAITEARCQRLDAELRTPRLTLLAPAHLQYYYFTRADQTASDVYANFVLPPGVSCQRCVMQWRWVTGNSCYGAHHHPGIPHMLSPAEKRPTIAPRRRLACCAAAVSGPVPAWDAAVCRAWSSHKCVKCLAQPALLDALLNENSSHRSAWHQSRVADVHHAQPVNILQLKPCVMYCSARHQLRVADVHHPQPARLRPGRLPGPGPAAAREVVSGSADPFQGSHDLTRHVRRLVLAHRACKGLPTRGTQCTGVRQDPSTIRHQTPDTLQTSADS